MPRTTRKTQWWKTVRKCGGRCWYCGWKPQDLMDLTVDHSLPESRGGTNAMSNLLPACLYCNQMKDSMTISQFRRYLKHLVARQLWELGVVVSLKSFRIVFYGEGNPSPLRW